MNKQEKIREAIKNHIQLCLDMAGATDTFADSISHSLPVILDGMGVVIKVDRRLAELMFIEGYGYLQSHSAQVLLDKSGCVAVEPLIKEG